MVSSLELCRSRLGGGKFPARIATVPGWRRTPASLQAPTGTFSSSAIIASSSFKSAGVLIAAAVVLLQSGTK
jgi:hypothetical protein